MVDDKFVGLAPYETYSAILSALDLAAENGARTVVFPPGFSIEANIYAYVTLIAMKKWLHDNPGIVSYINIITEFSDVLAIITFSLMVFLLSVKQIMILYLIITKFLL